MMTESIHDIETPINQEAAGAEKHRRLAEEDYAALYQLHARPLFRYLFRLTGDRRETEDCLQETFLRTWRWMREHTVDPAIMRPWLYTVARRIVIDAARARQARPTEVVAPDLALLSQPDNDIERLVQKLALRTALQSLSPEHRAVVIELFYNERTAKEAGEILGIPEGTVKSRAFYAVQALRQAAKDEERRAYSAGRRQRTAVSHLPARQPSSAQPVANGKKRRYGTRQLPADSRSRTPAAA
jgi:RNA polymerase sigma-70 factor (ECF subfamily)